MRLKRLFFVGIVFASMAASAAGNDWVARMTAIYTTPEMSGGDRSAILSNLQQTPVEAQEWVARMASAYITPETDGVMGGRNRTRILSALSQTPGEAQEWVAHMASTYITPEMPGVDRTRILFTLPKIPVEAQEWVERMAGTYITPEMPGVNRSHILCALPQTPVDSRAWVERMAGTYITPEMDGVNRSHILCALPQTPVDSQEWMEQRMAFLQDPQHRPVNVPSALTHIADLARDLQTPPLLEQARVRLVAGVNQAREQNQVLEDYLPNLVTRIRDELTQNQPINLAAARPFGQAMEIHFASALEVPVQNRTLPLYQAVGSQFRALGIGNDMTLADAVSRITTWVDRDADESHKALYKRVITKGYGDGLNPDYNQEITPLLRFVMPYMASLDHAVQSAWLLPALQESATAYDQGDPTSCAKGIQERLTVVSLDVESIDPILRSLSNFARTYMYIVIPETNGADAWIKEVVQYLTADERASLLNNDKPDQDAFNAMFHRALPAGLAAQSGLLEDYTTALLANPHVRTRFNESLEMHYEYDAHYQALRTKAQEILSPEQQRDLRAAAAERRLPSAASASATTGEDPQEAGA